MWIRLTQNICGRKDQKLVLKVDRVGAHGAMQALLAVTLQGSHHHDWRDGLGYWNSSLLLHVTQCCQSHMLTETVSRKQQHRRTLKVGSRPGPC